MPSVRNYSTIVQYQDIDSKLKNERPISSFCCQTFATLGGQVLSITCGIIVAFSGTTLPQLKEDSGFHLTTDQNSWIASIAALAMLVGGVCGYLPMNRLGRRQVLMMCCVICIVGWFFIALAANVAMLYVGRFLTGLFIGLITPSLCIYFVEVAEPRYRGFIMGVLTQIDSIGMLLVHLLGAYLNWRIVSYACILIQLFALLLIYLSPESPTWLICKGYISEAETTFRWLRQTSDQTDSENELQALLKKYSCSKIHRSPWQAGKTVTSSLFLKPFAITVIFFITQQLSGSSIIVFYTVDIIKNISPNFNEYTCTIAVDVLRIVGSVISCWFLKVYTRKFLLALSSICSIISILGIAFFIQYREDKILGIFPVVFVGAYVLVSTIGLIPLPWITASEIYALPIREFGNGVSTCFEFTLVFIVVKIAPNLFQIFGISGTYYALAVGTTIGSLIVYIILPETNNKSLQRVEEDLYDFEV